MIKYLFYNKKNTHLVTIFIIVILTLTAYWPIFNADFIGFDDPIYVTENDPVRAGLTLQGFIWAFSEVHSANWHPITWLSHMLDCEIYGLNPLGHHITNLIFHMLNCFLIYVFFYKVSGAYFPSLLLSLLFAIHPLHVESVAWISERKDVLSTFFGLLCLLYYSQHYIKRQTLQNYLIILIFFSLSLMAKAMLVTLPILMIFLDKWPLKRRDKYRYWDKIPMFIPVFAISLVTYFAQLQGEAINSLKEVQVSSRIMNALISIVKYLIKTIYPANQSILYPHPGNEISIWYALLSLIIIIGILLICLKWYSQKPFILLGFLWFLVSLLPVIGIIQVGSQSMADRYMYIPHIGLFWAFIWAGECLSKKNLLSKYILILLSFLAISGFTFKTRVQTHFWKDSISLFEESIANTKDNYILYNNLAICLYKKKSPKALDYLNKSIAISSSYHIPRMNRAKYMITVEKTDLAISDYNYVLKENPNNIKAYLGLADIYMEKKEYKRAENICYQALKRKSDSEKINYQLGQIFEKTGQYKKSAFFYKQALLKNPFSAITYYDYARILIFLKDFYTAIDALKRAIDLDPTFAKAYNNLGSLYAWNDQIEKACHYISKALQLDPNDPNTQKNYNRLILLKK
ncbi:Tetratricopeptide TPR_2 repeat protein [Candidatus Magnetomorum sp. HK-1]|nr:Tetratricopeptide TPR_2 repeat protein [Candidatus Magnetomorum sp. HK-1]